MSNELAYMPPNGPILPPEFGSRPQGNDDKFDRTVDAATVMDAKPFELFLKLRNELLDCPKVLEIGTMFGDMLMAAPGPTRIAVEVHLPFIARGKERYGRHIVYIWKNAVECLQLFTEDEFDAIIMIDFIEHLPKEPALLLLQRAKTVGKKIVLFTPMGFIERSVDHYGLGGEYWQTHRSGWEPEELRGLGFETIVWEKFHVDEYPNQPDALYAVWKKYGNSITAEA